MPYQVLSGAKTPIKVFVDDLAAVESEALDQLRKTANLPWVESVAAMPDVHLGKGATVGSVLICREAVSPSVVGVDIGCVDADTEFLSPLGWVRIADYAGEDVLQFDPKSGIGEFVKPFEYIRQPCEEMFHIKTKYGVDLMTDAGHRHLIYKYDRSYLFENWSVVTTDKLVADHERLVNGYRHRFNTTFHLSTDTEVALSDARLRLMVAVCADGHFPKQQSDDSRICVIGLRKGRKIERLRELLDAANIGYRENAYSDRVEFRFDAPMRTKTLASFWSCSHEQLKLISEECLLWDGNITDQVYFTRDRHSADFIQYCFSATGFRAVMRQDTRDGEIDYRVFRHTNTKVGINGAPEKISIDRVSPLDGLKYCFRVPSGFFAIRRGGNVVMTGNCGMMAVKTPYNANDLKDLAKLRHSIERSVPVGFNANKTVTLRAASLLRALGPIPEKAKSFEEKAGAQLGSLGGGNHFIEICTDESSNVWVMLHSGSRHIGKALAEIHIGAAKGLMHDMVRRFGESFDSELACLLVGTPEYQAYLSDLDYCQKYARFNREEMMQRVLKDLSYHMHGEDRGSEALTKMRVNCHHNYIEFGQDERGAKLITRKGAVSAKSGELGIIPGSMGTKSYIVRGRGSSDSYCSCSHGAGRRMSRGKAKRTFTQEDVYEQTKGVECRKDLEIRDELPGAYKPIDEVMANQSDLVEIVATLRALICVKG